MPRVEDPRRLLLSIHLDLVLDSLLAVSLLFRGVLIKPLENAISDVSLRLSLQDVENAECCDADEHQPAELENLVQTSPPDTILPHIDGMYKTICNYV